ncbi:MAG: metallophosphoesterase, partial [Clostridia bacterium]|nr:metallophosphoesterase [Clostridia bacterium]
AEGYEFLLLCGDLTENGDETSHLVVTNILHKLENTGVKVYVINGNHDVMSNVARKNYSVTQDRFKELYADFGYNEADSVLPETLCYSLPINDTFRLIAVDNMTYYTDADGSIMTEEMSDKKADWIIEQTLRAKSENRIPLYISHQSFINHWPSLLNIHDEHQTDAYEDIFSDILIQGAIFGFTGHSHLNDMKAYESSSYKYYEIMTGSTCYCQSNYRSITYNKDKIDVKTITLTQIDLDTVSPLVSDEIVAAVKADYAAYAEKHFADNINGTATHYINKIMSKFDFGNADLNHIVRDDVINKTLSMKLYEKDENNEESLEKVLKEYGLTLPGSNYKTFWDVVPTMVGTLIKGNENMRSSVEVKIAKYVFYALFYNINKNADRIAVCCNTEKKISIDLVKLFKEGELECYDSEFIPTFANFALSSEISMKKKIVFAAIASNFNSIELASDLVATYTGGVVTSIEKYFGEKEIHIEKLIEEGFCDDYFSDLLTDTDPDAREITIEIKHE